MSRIDTVCKETINNEVGSGRTHECCALYSIFAVTVPVPFTYSLSYLASALEVSALYLTWRRIQYVICTNRCQKTVLICHS
jgi:hypothetical protein